MDRGVKFYYSWKPNADRSYMFIWSYIYIQDGEEYLLYAEETILYDPLSLAKVIEIDGCKFEFRDYELLRSHIRDIPNYLKSLK